MMWAAVTAVTALLCIIGDIIRGERLVMRENSRIFSIVLLAFVLGVAWGLFKNF